MRNFIVWTISFLLVFEPTVWAANRPTPSELKAYIEFSEIGKRSMTLKELYGRTALYLTREMRAQMEPVIAEYGDYQVPKFDVTKLKNSKGEDYFQLSAVKDGQSVTLALGESEKSLVKINGKTIENSEMNSLAAVMTKAGVSKTDVQSLPAPKRVPAQAYIMNSKQIDKLNLDQQIPYFEAIHVIV